MGPSYDAPYPSVRLKKGQVFFFSMEECYVCHRRARKTEDFFSLPICPKCFRRLHLGPLVREGWDRWYDEKAGGMLRDEDKYSAVALAAFSSIVPRDAWTYIIGICCHSLDDIIEEGGFTFPAFVIAAWAVDRFGRGGGGNEIDDNKLHFLLNLGVLYEVSMIAGFADGLKKKGMSLDDERTMDIIHRNLWEIHSGMIKEMKRDSPSQEILDCLEEIEFELSSQH